MGSFQVLGHDNIYLCLPILVSWYPGILPPPAACDNWPKHAGTPHDSVLSRSSITSNSIETCLNPVLATPPHRISTNRGGVIPLADAGGQPVSDENSTTGPASPQPDSTLVNIAIKVLSTCCAQLAVCLLPVFACFRMSSPGYRGKG